MPSSLFHDQPQQNGRMNIQQAYQKAIEMTQGKSEEEVFRGMCQQMGANPDMILNLAKMVKK